MNTTILYYSKFGNTQKVAEEIAKVFEPLGSARVINSLQLSSTDFTGVDLVILGSPTYKMNVPEELREALKETPHKIFKSKKVAAFDTSYKLSGWLAGMSASHKLISKLRGLGGKPVVSPQIFHVVERQGPLVEGELERARDWANQIRQKLG
jgi:flavodoxin